MSQVDLLLPQPLRVETTGVAVPLTTGVRFAPAEDAEEPSPNARAWLARALARLELATDVEEGVPIGFELTGDAPPQGYALSVAPDSISIQASDAAGLFYGAVTLSQWLELHATSETDTFVCPGVRVLDRPTFAHRGVLLDVSRNRVPTMETLFSLVDRLASWKINQLQLYTEHTFAYTGHETVWRGASPLMPEDVRVLDAYCRERFVELVPNQNSFGHFHRWLRHPAYRELAECPDGVKHSFGDQVEPFSLCAVDPKVQELLADLYGQLLPNFSSPLFNVGLDETFDLGLGRSRDACEARGKEAVYAAFLSDVRRLAAEHGRRIQFWGDIVLEHPEALSRVPLDAIALNWGYEADHPFAAETARFAEAELEFYVCPGTSSWNSFAGRGRTTVLNMANAAIAGAEQGAAGYLITDWGDNGHLQPPPASYIGLLTGAAFAWNTATARDPMALDLAALLSHHALSEPSETLARALLALANAYADTPARPKNGTVLFHLLMSPGDDLEHPRYEKLTDAGLGKVVERMQKIRRELTAFEPTSGEQRLVRAELLWMSDALAAAARFGLSRLQVGRAVSVPELPRPVRRAVRIDLDSLAQDLPRLWLERSRPGGLEDSVARLRKLDGYLNLEP